MSEEQKKPSNGTLLPFENPETIRKYDQYLRLIREKEPGEMWSYNPTTEDGARKHVLATLGEVPDLTDFANQDIYITDFFAQQISKANGHGEIETWIRIVVFDDKGQAYSCGSEGVAKSLAVVFPISGMMPWKPPVKCKVSLRKLDSQKFWLTLQPDLDSLFHKGQGRK